MLPALLACVVPLHGFALPTDATFVQRVAPASQVREVLLESLQADVFLPEELRTRLVTLGDDAIVDLIDVLAEGSVSTEGDRLLLDAPHRLIVLGTLDRLSWPAVRSRLTALADGVADRDQRCAALEIIARCGTVEDLDLAASVAASGCGERPIERGVLRRFDTTCDALFDRRPEEVSELSPLYPRVHPSLAPLVIARFARDRSSERGRWLVGLLGKVPAADPLVLTKLEGVLADRSVQLSTAERRTLRAFLHHGDPEVVVCAMGALTAARDMEAAPELIALLDRPVSNVARRAHVALVSLTAMELGEDPEAWSRWIAEELDWWQQEAKSCARTIASGSPEHATQAVRTVAHKRLHPARAIELLLPGLDRAESELVALICRTLGKRRAPEALGPLLGRLEHRDAAVRGAAYDALREITGLRLGEDPDLWKRVLEARWHVSWNHD